MNYFNIKVKNVSYLKILMIIAFIFSLVLLIPGSVYFVDINSPKEIYIKLALLIGILGSTSCAIFLSEPNFTFNSFFVKSLLLLLIIFSSYILMLFCQISLPDLLCKLKKCTNGDSFGMVLIYLFCIPITILTYTLTQIKFRNIILTIGLSFLTGPFLMFIFLVFTI